MPDALRQTTIFLQQLDQSLHRAERVFDIVRDARRHLAQECELGLLNQGALELYLVGNELAQFDSRCQLLRQALVFAELVKRAAEQNKPEFRRKSSLRQLVRHHEARENSFVEAGFAGKKG